MRFAVLPLHERGRRRTRYELSRVEPVVGDVVIRPTDEVASVQRGWFLRADCVEQSPSTGEPIALIPPLHDARLVRVTNRHILITGVEIEAQDVSRSVREHVQLWSLRPVPENADAGRHGGVDGAGKPGEQAVQERRRGDEIMSATQAREHR